MFRKTSFLTVPFVELQGVERFRETDMFVVLMHERKFHPYIVQRLSTEQLDERKSACSIQ